MAVVGEARSTATGNGGRGGIETMSRSTDRFRRETMSYFLLAAVNPMALAILSPEFERDMPLPCLLPPALPGGRIWNKSSPRICACARAARHDSEKTSCNPWSIGARDCIDSRCMRVESNDIGEKNALTDAVEERRLSAAENVDDCEGWSCLRASPSNLESVFEYLSLDAAGVLTEHSLASFCFSRSEWDRIVGRPLAIS